jgi:hypothetical protein
MLKHPLSVVGAWLTTISAFVFLFVFLADLFGLHHNPYFGLVFFLILPAFFVLGLLLIPIGVWLDRRRRAKGLAAYVWPRIDLNQRRYQRGVAIIGALTVVNLLIVSLAAYKGIEYMDTTQFCGQVCHTVMEPEFTAHRDGPHSRVPCVDCHIGAGASWFVKAKLDGTRQVVAVMRNSYSRPIPSPVHDLRPARDTCETCHWPEKFHGDKIEEIRSYADDEKSTESVTTLVLHVGGGTHRFGLKPGVHWHADAGNEIDFVATDGKRQTIPYVRVKDTTGAVREYRTADVTDAQIQAGEHRRMDCIDCHNRPTHSFAATPERAVDGAIAAGAIPTTLPFTRREAVAAIKESYPDRATAERTIDERLRKFYASQPAGSIQPADIDRLVSATQFLYARNIFPAMNVTWGTHANNLGHMDFPGCFRCHDDQHKTADGKVIKQDCDLCHDMK